MIIVPTGQSGPETRLYGKIPAHTRFFFGYHWLALKTVVSSSKIHFIYEMISAELISDFNMDLSIDINKSKKNVNGIFIYEFMKVSFTRNALAIYTYRIVTSRIYILVISNLGAAKVYDGPDMDCRRITTNNKTNYNYTRSVKTTSFQATIIVHFQNQMSIKRKNNVFPDRNNNFQDNNCLELISFRIINALK